VRQLPCEVQGREGKIERLVVDIQHYTQHYTMLATLYSHLILADLPVFGDAEPAKQPFDNTMCAECPVKSLCGDEKGKEEMLKVNFCMGCGKVSSLNFHFAICDRL